MLATTRLSLSLRGGPGRIPGNDGVWVGTVTDRIALAVIWSVVILSWVGEALAELGRFSLALDVVASGVLGATVWFVRQHFTYSVSAAGVPSGHEARHGRLFRPRVTRFSRFEISGLLALLLIALFLYIRPTEAIFGTHDAGARLNAAAHIARSGAIPIHDPLISSAVQSTGLSVPLGVYAVDPAHGRLLPQFSGVSEVWEALALSTFDLPRSALVGYQTIPTSFPSRPLYIPAIFAAGALLMMFATCRREFSTGVAFAATFGLALSYPEITFARLTMAEIPTQFFCLAALYALSVYQADRNGWTAGLAGACVGLAFLTHVDAGPLYAVVAGSAVWLAARHRFRVEYLSFYAPATLLFLQGILHYVVFEWPYVYTNVGSFLLLLKRTGAGSVFAGLLVTVALAAAVIRSGRVTLAPRGRAYLRWSAIVVVWAVAGFDYFVRPALVPPAVIVGTGVTPTVVTNGGVIFVLLGQYVFPFTLLLTVIGASVVLTTRTSLTTRVVLASAGLYLVFFGWNPLVSPPQPFWVRRFVTVALPGLMILSALAIAWIASRVRQQRARALVFIALALIFDAGVASVGLPLWFLPAEYGGGLAETNQFAQSLPTNSVILFDQSEAAHWLPLPLTYLFNRDTFILNGAPSVDAQNRIANAVDSWLGQGRPVIFVTSGGRETLGASQYRFEPLVEERFRFPAFPLEFWRPPTRYVWEDFHVAAYRLERKVSDAPVTFPFTLNLGRFDYPYLVAGFEPNDYTGDTSYRYTGTHAEVRLPRPSTRRVRLTIRMAGLRPAGVPSAHLQITLDGRPLDQVAFPAGQERGSAFRNYVYEAAISPNVDWPLLVDFDTNVWRPADYGLSDIRSVGVAVVSVRVDAVSPSTLSP